MSKKILSIICCIAICFNVLPLWAAAESEIVTHVANTGGVFTFDKSSQAITAYDSTDASSTDLEIPEKIEEVDVKMLGEGLFQGERITSVKIPATVTHIGKSSFDHCEELISVTFGDNSLLTDIGEYAFNYCTLLENIVLPEGVTNIGDGAFFHCRGFSTLELPNSLTTIGATAFAECYITSLTIPDSVTSIGVGAFSRCTMLESVVLPSNPSYAKIEDRIFDNCVRLKNVNIPEYITMIGTHAFYLCDALESVDIPESVTEIGSYAFHGCTTLESINLPNGLERIPYSAFAYSGIKLFHIPANCKSIGRYAFAGNDDAVIYVYNRDLVFEAEPITYETQNVRFYGYATKSDGTTVSEIKSKAQLYGYTFFELEETAGLFVELKGPDGSVINGGYTVKWTDKDENVVASGIEGEDYHYEITLGEELAFIYKAPEKGTLENVSSGINTATVTLEELSKRTLSGKVFPAAASVSITQMAGEYSSKIALEPDSSGNFSAEIKQLDTLVAVTHNGYYGTRLFKSAANLTGNWDTGEIVLSELPASNIMKISLEKIIGDSTSGITQLHGLTFSLEKKVGEGFVELDPGKYIVQYPHIILKDDTINNNTQLKLTVAAEPELKLASGSSTISKSDGEFFVTLKEFGCFKASLSSAAVGNKMVMLFDDEGNLVDSGKIKSGYDVYNSNPIKEGNYTVIFMAENNLFTGISSLSALENMGFSEGTDYLKKTVTINDGTITVLNNLSIPQLNVSGSRASLLDKDFSYVKGACSSIAVLRHFILTVNYKLAEGTGQNKTITVNLPDGAEITAKSNSMGATLNQEGNKLTCETTQSQGSIHIAMYFTKVGKHSVSASLSTSGATVPVGSFTINAENISLLMDEIQTDWENVQAEIMMVPGATVKAYLDGVPVQLKSGGGLTGTIKANAAGRAVMVFSLPQLPSAGSKHYVTAEVAIPGGDTISTVVPCVFTFYPTATVKTLKFVHGGIAYTLNYENIQNSNKYYTYLAFDDEKYWNWTFYADIEGYSMLDKDSVMLKITMLDGSFRIIPLAYLEDQNDSIDNICTFAGSIVIQPAGDHVFKSNLIPCEFAISFGTLSSPDLTLSHTVILEDVKKRYDDLFEGWPVNEDEVDGMVGVFLSEIGAAAGDLPAGGKPQAFYTYPYEKISQTDYFRDLPDESKAMVYNAEAVEDEFSSLLSEVLGIEDIRSYQDQNSLYEDLGIVYEEYDEFPQGLENELIQEGYSRYRYSDAGGGEVYLKYDEDKMGYKLYSTNPEETFRLFVRFPNYAREYYEAIQEANPIEEPKISGFDGLTLFGAQQEKTPWWKQAIPATGDIISRVVESAAIGAEKASEQFAHVAKKNLEIAVASTSEYADNVKLAAYKTCYDSTRKATFFKNLGDGISVISLGLNYNDLISLDDLESELKGRSINLLDMFQRIDFSEQDGIDCSDAIIEEQRAIQDLRRYLNDKRFYTEVKMLFDSGLAIGDIFSFGMCSAAKLTLVGGTIACDSGSAYILAQHIERLNKARADVEKYCGDGKKWNKRRNIEPILDPSGYVYEAVASNRLGGVTATAYKKGEGGAPQLWDALDYDQQNPLTTDWEGKYAWDVPVGNWQVKYEKDGYITKTTDWLPVPPPQMDVNIALVSTSVPAVSSIHAYEDYIEIIFSQYMDITSFGGLTVDGSSDGIALVFPDKEVSPLDSGAYYAKALRVKKTNGSFEGTTSVNITGAKNYAGTGLADYSSGCLTVEARPAEMLFNYETIILEAGGTTSNVTVRVLDSKGKPMPGVKLSAVSEIPTLATISPSVTTDAEGKAVFTATGILPGATAFKVCIDGASLSETIDVSIVTGAERPERPIAVLGSTILGASAPQENTVTVTAGTKLQLACSTEGTKIYYTTNNTCPCQAGLGRMEYTGPVTIAGNTYFRIASYKKGMKYSERINIAVTVISGGTGGSSGENASNTQKNDELLVIETTDENVDDRPVMNEMEFEDVPTNAWYYDAVKFVFEKGLFRGTSAKTFSPNVPMTRAMLVTVLYRMEGEPSGNSNKFVDVTEGAWYTDAVAWAAANSIINGAGNNIFEPEREMTRAEMATILYRYAAYKKYGVSKQNDLSGYIDNKEIPNWAITPMKWANGEALITGTTGTTLAPGGKALRAEVATILKRFFDNVVK